MFLLFKTRKITSSSLKNCLKRQLPKFPEFFHFVPNLEKKQNYQKDNGPVLHFLFHRPICVQFDATLRV